MTFVTAAVVVLLLGGAAENGRDVEYNEGQPRAVSFEDAQKLLGEAPSITFVDRDDKSSLRKIPEIDLDAECHHFSSGRQPTRENAFQFYALRLTNKEHPDVLVTKAVCTLKKGDILATLFSYDGSKYTPSWVQQGLFDYNSVFDIRDLDGDGYDELVFLQSNGSVFSQAPSLIWGRSGKVVSERYDGLSSLQKAGKSILLVIEKRAMDDKPSKYTCLRFGGPQKGPVKTACPK
jgi:hypothetical protein